MALVGNPNCGKTSLFNLASGAHEHVGNYSGVTVDAKEGYFDFEGYHFRIVDLPGTYSLSAYTPEEIYVRRHIINETPDVIINVVDSSNLERNLHLTTQLIDMNVRMVVALGYLRRTGGQRKHPGSQAAEQALRGADDSHGDPEQPRTGHAVSCGYQSLRRGRLLRPRRCG